MKKLELVDNASEWKQWWSMRWIIASTFFTSIIAAYTMLPPDWLPEIGPAVKKSLAIGSLFSLGAAGVSRVLKQPIKHGADDAGLH